MPPLEFIRSIIAEWLAWYGKKTRKALATTPDPDLARQRQIHGVRKERGNARQEYAKSCSAHRGQKSAWRRLSDLTHDELRLEVRQ